MITLNLLPDIKKEYLKAQRTRNMVVSTSILVSIIAVGLVVLLAMTVYIGQSLVIAQQSNQITENHKKLSAKPEIDKYLSIQNQLAAIDSISTSRSTYARLFDYLQQLNPAPPYNISLYNFTVEKKTNVMKFVGGAPNFETVNNFKNAIENARLSYFVGQDNKEIPFFPSVTISEANFSSGNGKAVTAFNFEVTYAPEAFDSQNAYTKLIVPRMVTSDADKNAPKEIFATPPANNAQGGNNGN